MEGAIIVFCYVLVHETKIPSSAMNANQIEHVQELWVLGVYESSCPTSTFFAVYPSTYSSHVSLVISYHQK
jgi:hypothetical protein